MGVSSSPLVLASLPAPFFSRSFTILVRPWRAALWRAVYPLLSEEFTVTWVCQRSTNRDDKEDARNDNYLLEPCTPLTLAERVALVMRLSA